ncbi:hypothetical protein J4453_03125 [Candidatus Woesearchaeota archaeon]|nr:hypothetical protein [Candidatus Woesearchaeota archaeon]
MTFFKGFKKGVKMFGQNIGVIVNTALLAIVYIIGVGITSIIAKLFRKHFLDLKHSPHSYWSDLNLKKKPMKDYYRQF